MTGKMVNFHGANERTISGYLATPASGQEAGVLALHAWWGLNDFFKAFCDQLAAQGFVVLAPDLYGEGRVATTIEEAERLSGSLNGEQTYKDISGAVDYLLAQPGVRGERVGVVGFSLGAGFALMLEEHIGAIVVFYGLTDPQYISAEAAFQGHFAEHDPYESAEGVRETEERLRGLGREVEFYTYPGTGHWFFEEDRPDAYNAEAAKLAWERTVNFLKGRM